MVKFKTLRLLAFLFTIILMCNGCYVDMVTFDEKEVITPLIEGNIDAFNQNIPDYFEEVEFNNDELFVIVTDNETIIEIRPNIFELDGEDINSANIKLKYIELLKPSLYAFTGLPTISGGELLRTEGVFRFEATQNGTPLKLKEGKGITVRMPDDSPDVNAQLFEAVGEGEDFDWRPLDAGPDTGFEGIMVTEWQVTDSSIQNVVAGYGYEFNCPLWNWINVDIFYDIPESEKTSVCVELPEAYTDQNTLVFMLFKDIESILALHPDAAKQQFCEPYGATPIGFEVYFFVISNQGDDIFHFALQAATIKENHVEFIEPEEKSLEDIIKIIEDL